MPNDINTKRKRLWEQFVSKVFRDAFVAGEITNSIGAQIFALREREGWTQTELARRSAMAQARISLLESASAENFNYSTLKRIASAFDVALIVRFAPFSELVARATPTSDAWLAPKSFQKDEVELIEPTPNQSDDFLANLFPQRRSPRDFQEERFRAPLELPSNVEEQNALMPATASPAIQPTHTPFHRTLDVPNQESIQ